MTMSMGRHKVMAAYSCHFSVVAFNVGVIAAQGKWREEIVFYRSSLRQEIEFHYDARGENVTINKIYFTSNGIHEMYGKKHLISL